MGAKDWEGVSGGMVVNVNVGLQGLVGGPQLRPRNRDRCATWSCPPYTGRSGAAPAGGPGLGPRGLRHTAPGKELDADWVAARTEVRHVGTRAAAAAWGTGPRTARAGGAHVPSFQLYAAVL